MSVTTVYSFGPLNSSSIHSTCIRGDKTQLKQFLVSPEDGALEQKDSSGKTPLIYATIGNHVDCVVLLLKAGVIVDNADKNGQTALHWATYKGHWQCVKALMEKGAVWYRKDLDSVTSLHLAAINPSTKCLQLILQIGNDYRNYDLWDNAKKTALHWSASVANYEHMKLLLKSDANVNIPDVEGRTPLHWAAACNSPKALDCVKLLLTSLPSVLHEAWQDYQGKTALHLAVIMGTNEVVNVLTINGKSLNLQDNMFRTPLHWATLMGLTEKANILLDRGPDLSARDANGATPLHYAANGNYADTVSAFLSRKLVRDKADNYGCSALLWAAARGADKVLKVMKQYGADLHATDQNNNTTLHAASLQGHASTVEWLIDQGCRTDAKNSCGQTPLLLSCQVGRAKVLRVLLNKDISSLNMRDMFGRTALHCAAIGGHALICQTILQCEEADPNIQDYYGLSPLHYASYKGSLNCMSVLIENGANPNCADHHGQTPVHWACLRGKLEPVQLLYEAEARLNSLSWNSERSTPLDYAVQSGQVPLLEYLWEHQAVSSSVIINLAALIIQNFLRNCSRRKGRKLFQITLDPALIIKSACDTKGGVNSIISSIASCKPLNSISNLSNHMPRNSRLTVSPELPNRKSESPKASELRSAINANELSLSRLIYVSEVDVPKNGQPVSIVGLCLGCNSEVAIKTPACKQVLDKTQKFSLRTHAAVVIQRTWRAYIKRTRV